jgi:hypothetical protein
MVTTFYEHSRVKQYRKERRAMRRIESVINCPRDLACNARLPNLAKLQDKAPPHQPAHAGSRARRVRQPSWQARSAPDETALTPLLNDADMALPGSVSRSRTDGHRDVGRADGRLVVAALGARKPASWVYPDLRL